MVSRGQVSFYFKELICHFLAEHFHQNSMVTQIREDKTTSLHKFYLIWTQMEFPMCLFLHNTIMHCPLFINWKNIMIPAEKSLSCKYYILEEWHNIHINIAHTLHSAEIQSCYQNIYWESWWSKKPIPWCLIKLLLSPRDSDDACLHRLQAAKMGKIF